MLTHHQTHTTVATPTATRAETETLASLMVEDEAVVSDAPTYSPEAAGLLLLALLLSPKPPREKSTR
ncbi:hypothetical protein ACIPLC_14710 [Kitasatospora sp. NPDC086801]|uniref:hypothetical protein n=1 Tax=Kitasatospora sp. NPDC086801 TaxID=3364066 RepID=UPI003823B6C0